VRKEDLIAYARRDWAAIAEHKLRVWAQLKSEMTAADALRIGDDIRKHVRAIHPEWPTNEQRSEDLATHVRVSEMLRRVRSNKSH
jgi:hypothetical protein